MGATAIKEPGGVAKLRTRVKFVTPNLASLIFAALSQELNIFYSKIPKMKSSKSLGKLRGIKSLGV